MIKENKYILLRDGVKIHAQIKEVGGPFWIVVTHGLGEHLGRHNYMLSLFNNNFNIFQYDLRGHGKSEGRRAYVKNFVSFVDDLKEVLDYIQDVYKAKRIVLFGHSMGALITAGYIQNLADINKNKNKNKNKNNNIFYPESVFLSAPPVSVPSLLGMGLKLWPKLTNKLSQLPLSVPLGGMIDLQKLSHDGQVYVDYISDELNSLKIQTQLLFSIIDYANQVFTRPLRAKCPIACAYGSKDVIVSTKAIDYYFRNLEKEASLFKVEGAYHEMHNEISKYKDQYFKHFTQFVLKTFYQECE